ncbi:hypothetical protein ASD24_24930 [Paenibacillus sp. Root52]|uniref:hypothetical protein n=1 Tax=Paenibacillus sp. Root52 TaxID=1736552 RepID=UPI0006F2238E|nr:hypothetical protein [Paenibacillus sp. Root52]KQY91044.1 hypothetical protein ASD24_24930 [Paenibacillus sp. Root52]
MRIIDDPQIQKGFVNGNTFFVTQTETDGLYNIYQAFNEFNDYATPSDIRAAQAAFKDLPDEEIIVSIAGENQNAFLMYYQIPVEKVNEFKISAKEKN